MAEKKLTKKFGQKRDFKSEEKKTKNNTYMKKKTYKEPVKKQQKTTDEKCEPKKVASKKTENITLSGARKMWRMSASGYAL